MKLNTRALHYSAPESWPSLPMCLREALVEPDLTLARNRNHDQFAVPTSNPPSLVEPESLNPQLEDAATEMLLAVVHFKG